jgi:hypothetical protein
MNNDELTTKLINVCAWCGREQYGVFDDSASKTHGICNDCLANVNEERKPLMSYE